MNEETRRVAGPDDGAEKTSLPGYDPDDELISIEEFLRIRLRVAEVIAAEPHPNADKLLKLQVRIGEREKQLCAGIRGSYEPEALVGKRVIVVDNLKPARLRGEESQGMLLAASNNEEGVVLLTPDKANMASGSVVR